MNRTGPCNRVVDLTTLKAALDRTEAFLRDASYRGWDPYDGLMSPFFGRAPFTRSARLRYVTQQVIKRLVWQVRPLLRIPHGYNPVTPGLVLQAYVYRAEAAPERRGAYAQDFTGLLDDLDALRSPGFAHACWGYDFFWQAKAIPTPPYHPTIVATGFVTNALFELWRAFGDERAAELIEDAIGFFEHDLNRIEYGESFSWSYSPSDRKAVVNASMKGARFCAQAAVVMGRADLNDLAARTVRFALANQQANGRWPYAVNDPRGWADNFHTGYVLDCLDEYRNLAGDNSCDEPIARGFAYYRDHFFAEGCIPKYFDTRLYPVDASACAQSILTLCRFGELERAARVGAWCLEHLALPDGSFKYQIHRYGENRLVYMRWSVAWMFLALSRLERDLAGTVGSTTGTAGRRTSEADPG